MRLFSKDLAAGRSYSELQKRTKERMSVQRQAAPGQKELQEFGGLDGELDELRQVMERMNTRLDEWKGTQEDLRFLKEKQDYVLRNFPTLEGNVVEKLKGAQAGQVREILDRLEVLEAGLRKRNIWSKVLLWFSLVCSFLSAGGVAVLLLHAAGYSVF